MSNLFSKKVVFDSDLIRRYDKAGPRYTSYPTAVQFHSDFGERQYRTAARSGEHTDQPLSLYVHIPFCDTICFYCACNKIVTKNRRRAAPYLASVYREIALQGSLFEGRRVDQLHWGGGTPTFISHEEMHQLMETTRRHFRLRDDDAGEYSIEIDPREVRKGTLTLLRRLGFNRLSMGVQDFDPAVQQAVNRRQSEAQTLGVLHEARSLGFRSINMDLIYGLPRQSVESFARTLDKIVAAAPDRISVFNYAHLPDLFKTQRQINTEDLPDPQTKLELLQYTVDRLTDAGYLYIGMDHFAKPDDELAVAQRNGTLYRNFQGYSTHADCDLIGIGVTAIGKVGDTYSQNEKTLDRYTSTVAEGRLPILRGIELDTDDRLRREIIMTLICLFRLDTTVVEQRFNIEFASYFSGEIDTLTRLESAGLVAIEPTAITVLPPGKPLIRHICMIFDKYLQHRQSARYSRII